MAARGSRKRTAVTAKVPTPPLPENKNDARHVQALQRQIARQVAWRNKVSADTMERIAQAQEELARFGNEYTVDVDNPDFTDPDVRAQFLHN